MIRSTTQRVFVQVAILDLVEIRNQTNANTKNYMLVVYARTATSFDTNK